MRHAEQRIYLDYAATTPVDAKVLEAMKPYFSAHFGNPGSLHSFGQEASRAVFLARRSIAEAIGADYREIIFTGSATEANNLALRGALKGFGVQSGEGFRVQGMGSRVKNEKNFLNPRIIISAIEHESIIETAKDLERQGVEVIYLPVSQEGIVDLKKLEASLNQRAILVSIMYANNEIGSIQPIAEIAKIIQGFRAQGLRPRVCSRGKTPNPSSHTPYPLLHTDAVQALQYLDCGVNNLGVDLMTVSAHKIYGPKGMGILYARGFRVQGIGSSKQNHLNPIGYTLNPIITGGGQESGLRSGTENVPYVIGFAKAVEFALKYQAREISRINGLRDYFWSGLKKIYPTAEVNGPSLDSQTRLPNNLNVYLPGHETADLLIKLDLKGIAASSGSACFSRASRLSNVLKAMGFGARRLKSGLRFTFGRPTSRSELIRALKIIKTVLKK